MESGQGVQLLTRACGDGIMDRCCSIFFKARVSFTISQPHCFFKASRCNSQGFSLLLLDEPSNHLDLDAWKLRFKDVLFQGRADDGLRPDLSFPFSLSVSFPSVMRCVALLDTTRRELGEKEHDRSFGLKNFRYIEEIKEALERECPGLVSCSDILVLYARERIEAVGGPHIPLKTGRRDGRKSRTDMLESYLPDHNESISVVLDKFKSIGIG